MKVHLFHLPLALLGLIGTASCTSSRSPLAPDTVATDLGAIGAGEGPAWKDGSLYFTDGQHINRRDADGKTTVFRHNASNGLLFDAAGRLTACESGLRRVTRTEEDGTITVLASDFEGKRFNSPNDLCVNSKGDVYFTDPRYGSRKGMEIRDNQGRLIEGVYRINRPANLPSGLCMFAYDIPNVTLILGPEEVQRPNGILISPDDRYLYIADNNNNTRGGSRKLLRFTLNRHGRVQPGSRKVLFDWQDGRGPDGIKMDAAGRLYVAAGRNQANDFETTRFKAGCYIFSPHGRLLDFIPTAPDEATNCAFGGNEGDTLFITSGQHLWSVPLHR
ncbi:MAG: SMP-30/gluconolactonase/LRE family protein [Verrucomicrobiales bacterium]|nr:SMP-30/gluconolactonase/LRE family protein [Verrucomicrobiales bacterium]